MSSKESETPETAREVYEQFQEPIDEMAQRDDEVGAVMRVVQAVATVDEGGDPDG